MSIVLDATKKACPIPFVMAKKELAKNTPSFTILVDNLPAVANLKRLGDVEGCSLVIQDTTLPYELHFTQAHVKTKSVPKNESVTSPALGPTFYITHDAIGDDSVPLAKNLMQMFLYSLTQSDVTPYAVLLLNKGVFLATEEGQSIDHLRQLQQNGTKVLVCGTCLDFYDKKESLQVGTMCTMYDISETLNESHKVVTV